MMFEKLRADSLNTWIINCDINSCHDVEIYFHQTELLLLLSIKMRIGIQL